MQQTVIGIVGQNQNASLRATTNCYAPPLRELGYNLQIIDLLSPTDAEILNQLIQKNDIAFAFGLQGVGSHLSLADGQSLWSATQTPFLCLHHDHPCYNLPNHVNGSSYVANLYYFSSFLETRERYLPSGQISRATRFELISEPVFGPKKTLPERPIRLLYLKNLTDLPELTSYEQALPEPVRDAVRQQMERLWNDPNLQICDLVAEIFAALGFDRAALQEPYWTLVRLMDHGIRHKRSIAMVEWLKHQEGAVIIGDGWDAIDKTNASAIFKPAVDSEASADLYEQAQFVCNTSPYGRDIVHERMVYGLIAHACVICDRNQWLNDECGDMPALQFFDWGQSLNDQLRPLIDHLPVAAARAATGGLAAVRFFPSDNKAEALLRLAEEVKCLNQKN